MVLVAGSANSSNSQRLVETAERAGTPAYLIDDTEDIELGWLAGASTVGHHGGRLGAACCGRPDRRRAVPASGRSRSSERVVATENIRFGLPKEVRQS